MRMLRSAYISCDAGFGPGTHHPRRPAVGGVTIFIFGILVDVIR